MHTRSAAALLLTLTATLPSLSAQTSAASHKRPLAPVQAPASKPCATTAVTLHMQPYTLKQQTTRTQTLANGSNISTTEETITARDSQGRFRRETIRSVGGDVSRSISVFDPATQIRYVWNVGPGFPLTVSVYRPRSNQQQTIQPQPAHRYYPFHSESLPPQTIAGLYAEGVRSTRTIPAGYQGNDQDLVTTTETWNSPDLNLVLRSSSDDPRMGKTTIDTTDVQRTEPDPSLFQPPPGYQLQEQNP